MLFIRKDGVHCNVGSLLFPSGRPSSEEKSAEATDIFLTGGRAQLHFIAFGGVFPYIAEPILDDENSTKCQNLPPKSDHFTPKLMSFY